MLISDLYKYLITSRQLPATSGQEGTIEATVTVNRESAVYRGHFPGFAITPGVCQVLMIQEILEGALNIRLRLSGAKSIKFTAMHEPDKAGEIQARISYTRDGSRLTVEGMLFKETTTYLKFKGAFIEQSEAIQGGV
ncbi:MAG: hypothetical protein ABFS10_09020 [Bacteroidota bacterium]